MQLNHLNLCVDDLAEARTFFQNCFDFQFLEQKGNGIVVMTDRHGFTLVLSNPRAFKNAMQPYPEGFHIGFLLETTDQVDHVYRRLAAAEVQLTQEPRKMRGGYGFYFTALNAILFEVSSPL
jgi:catechol 2,3-dioxygenase-like lactoylglutathione lyase family enzyme